MENPRFPTLHHSLRAAFLLLPVALRAKHSQKGIAKDFLANGKRKTKSIPLEEKRSFSTLKNTKILFVFRSYQKATGTVLSRRYVAHIPRRKIESLKQCREDFSWNFSFFAPIIVQAYDEWAKTEKEKQIQIEPKENAVFQPQCLYIKRLWLLVFDFLYLLFVSTKIVRHDQLSQL